MTALAPRRASRVGPLVLGGLIPAATAVVMSPAPGPVRSLAALALLLISGRCATTLVLGRRRHPARSDQQDGWETVPRATLPVVFALLTLLAAVLLLPLAGVGVDTRHVAVGLGASSLLLLLVRCLTIPLSPWPGLRPRRVLRGGLGLAAAVAVLGLGVAGAIALQPATPERYPLIALDDPSVRTGQPLVSRPGGPLEVSFTLGAHGVDLGRAPSPVQVLVGGAPVPAALVGPLTVEGGAPTGVTDRQRLAVRFTAPAQQGLYPVQLVATPTTGDPIALTLIVQVQP